MKTVLESMRTPLVARRLIIFVPAIVASLALAACGMIAHTQNYRLTATIDVAGRLYEGSSVQQFSCKSGGGLLRDMDVARCYVNGEGVVVDLGDRGTLLVTMLSGRKDPKTGKPRLGFATEMLGDLELIDTATRKHNTKHAWSIPSDRTPAFITFDNTDQPGTVKLVDPNSLNLAFGPGVKFKSFTVERTSAVPTKGVMGKKLPWLERLSGSYLNGSRGQSIEDQSLAAQISTRDLEYWD